jgi:hypothetical protein
MLPPIASNVADLNLVQQGYITIGDVCHKFGVRIEQHNMEMLYGVYGLQAGPVLEPDAISSANVVSKRLVNVQVELSSGCIGQVSTNGVFLQLELDPYNEVHDS